MELVPDSSHYRPGEPLRKWDPVNPVAIMEISLTIQKGNAADALIRLVNDEELSFVGKADPIKYATPHPCVEAATQTHRGPGPNQSSPRKQSTG